MAFTLPELPYAFDALEPSVDARTMEIHHGKHHAGYVSKLNDAIKGSDLETKPIDVLCASVATLPDAVRSAVRNHGGGHFNHSMFWKIMAPPRKGGGGEPSGPLAEAIDRTFSSFDGFKEKFAAAAMARFGSGWAWLGVKSNGTLCITSTPNQDNPLMTGVAETPCTPILGLDVWEHAYYLKYQNRRPDYVTAWWDVVSWPAVADRFSAAR